MTKGDSAHILEELSVSLKLYTVMELRETEEFAERFVMLRVCD